VSGQVGGEGLLGCTMMTEGLDVLIEARPLFVFVQGRF
jgi:hypothetical protein